MENANRDDVLRQWQEFRATTVSATDRKIQRLVYRSNGEEHVAEVGYKASDGSVVQWIVTAIFAPAGDTATDPWSVCLVAIGADGFVAMRNPPIQVARSSVLEAMDFI